MPTETTCPDCSLPLSPQNAVVLVVEVIAGDDTCGQSTTTRVPVCGACAQKLASHYATAAQRYVGA